MKKYLSLFCILIIIFGFYFIKSNSGWIDINSNSIKKIKYNDDYIDIEIKSSKDLEKIINLNLFRGYKPINSIRELYKKYGKPDNISKQNNDDELFEYYYTDVKITYLKQILADDRVAFTLHACPYNKTIFDLFSNEVISLIGDKLENEKTLFITDKNSKSKFIVQIIGNRIIFISPGMWKEF